MRISDIAAWAECETMALSDPKRTATISAAAWVGTLAHAKLLGTPMPALPGRITCDAITPIVTHMGAQAYDIAECARERLENNGWSIVDTETPVDRGDVHGRLDMWCWKRKTKAEAIIDLKTGQQVGAAWLQVGGYLDQLSDKMPMFGGILHVPRTRVDKEVSGKLYIRDSLRFNLRMDDFA